MKGFANAILVGVVTFFIVLVGFWYLVEMRSPERLQVQEVSAAWGPSSPEGTLIDVAILLENPRRTAAEVTSISYQASLDGRRLDAAQVPESLVVPPGGTLEAGFTALLPADFVPAWWRAYGAEGEATHLRINGTLAFRQAGDPHAVPFEWESRWKGHLAETVAAGAGNCGDANLSVCLVEAEPRWWDGGLNTTLVLRNDGAANATIRNATVRLLFSSEAVAEGTAAGPLLVEPREDGRLPVDLVFDAPPLVDWWPDHVRRCEITRVSLAVQLTVEVAPELPERPPPAANETPPPPPPPEVTRLAWEFDDETFRTRFLCGLAP